MADRIYNFSAGPATLPLPVLEKAQQELLCYNGAGASVMEISHRSAEFTEIIERAEAGVRKNFSVPDDYTVLFLQGGASLQFAMVPMNLAGPEKTVDMIHTGNWTKKAMAEVKKLARLRLAASTEDDNFLRLPTPDEINLDPSAAYVHICSNNTIFGTQYKNYPETGDVPLVADMSSDIMSKPVDVSKFGLIFAGAQKNLGPSGVALVIIKKDLAERAPETLPTLLQYRSQIKAGSLFNTPPTFGIYILGLVMDWMKDEGGIEAIQKRNEEKAALLYDAIDGNDFFYCPVKKEDRSLMNVVFRVKGDDEEMEKKLIAGAKGAGIGGIKGHRSVGGLRASIYNAMPVEGVQALVDYMNDFSKKNG